MAGYIELTDSCRQLYLMAYFGQREKEVCGICDLCLEQKKRPGNTNRKTEEKILELLKQKDYEIRELIANRSECNTLKFFAYSFA